jgi:hypothetical protein
MIPVRPKRATTTEFVSGPGSGPCLMSKLISLARPETILYSRTTSPMPFHHIKFGALQLP